MKFLIDTDWVIHYLNGHEEIIKRLISFRPEGLAISIVSLAELYEGIYSSTNPTGNEQDLEGFLTGVSILGVDQEICQVFGKERGILRQQKKLIDNFDLLIASSAINYDLTLLTNNRKHFEVIESLKIMSI